jgi:hypothetical protein
MNIRRTTTKFDFIIGDSINDTKWDCYYYSQSISFPHLLQPGALKVEVG